MKNEIRFTLESKQRPKLAREIGNILGTAPHYERVPSCAYDIAGYRLDKEGVLHIPDGVEEETVEDLILKLRECGFQDDAEVTEEVPVQQGKLTIASYGFHTQRIAMRLQPTHNLSQGCVTWQEMQKGYHQSRLKRTMTNTLSAVFCSDLALLGKSIR